jgi:hypothetical protein
MIIITPYFLVSIGLIYFGIGFTLLRYSKDGDLNLQEIKEKKKKLNKDELWNKLSDLANATATEVNWNTSLFISLSSSLILLGVYKNIDFFNSKHLFSAWLVSVFVIYAFQDIVVRWKQAHRKHAISKEQIELIKELRWFV